MITPIDVYTDLIKIRLMLDIDLAKGKQQLTNFINMLKEEVEKK